MKLKMSGVLPQRSSDVVYGQSAKELPGENGLLSKAARKLRMRPNGNTGEVIRLQEADVQIQAFVNDEVVSRLIWAFSSRRRAQCFTASVFLKIYNLALSTQSPRHVPDHGDQAPAHVLLPVLPDSTKERGSLQSGPPQSSIIFRISTNVSISRERMGTVPTSKTKNKPSQTCGTLPS